MGCVFHRDITMHTSKICFKCDFEKPLSEFYKHPQMTDGHLGKCKECSKKDVIANRAAKIDYYLEYDRQRANVPCRVDARLRYSKTDAGRKAARKGRSKWLEGNLIKRAASTIVGNYVRDGKLIKKDNCESCGASNCRIHGHHDDYAYPLSVRWLCAKCHCAWHKENGAGVNG